MCATDRHDMTLAVKEALNPHTTNQSVPSESSIILVGVCLDNTHQSPCIVQVEARKDLKYLSCPCDTDWKNVETPFKQSFSLFFGYVPYNRWWHVLLLKELVKWWSSSLIFSWLIDCVVFNPVFKVMSGISQLVYLSMLPWISFY